MLKKLFGKKQEVNESQCPYCNSRKITPAGEWKEGVLPMQCLNCRARYDILYVPAGYVIEGQEYRIDKNGHNPTGITLDISWYEIRMRNRKGMQCPDCQDWYSALYTRAAHPEDAVNDPEARCWDCAGVDNFFPRNADISIPQIWK